MKIDEEDASCIKKVYFYLIFEEKVSMSDYYDSAAKALNDKEIANSVYNIKTSPLMEGWIKE